MGDSPHLEHTNVVSLGRHPCATLLYLESYRGKVIKHALTRILLHYQASFH